MENGAALYFDKLWWGETVFWVSILAYFGLMSLFEIKVSS